MKSRQMTQNGRAVWKQQLQKKTGTSFFSPSLLQPSLPPLSIRKTDFDIYFFSITSSNLPASQQYIMLRRLESLTCRQNEIKWFIFHIFFLAKTWHPNFNNHSSDFRILYVQNIFACVERISPVQTSQQQIQCECYEVWFQNTI